MALASHDIDFEKSVKILLGTKHRKPKRIAWLKACLAGLRNLHDKFLTFTDAKLEEISVTGQTFILQNWLCEKFGDGIEIINNIDNLDGFFVGAGTDITDWIGDGTDIESYISETATINPFDFTVNVPSAITFNQVEMEAEIRKYKLFGTTFNIVIV